MKNNDITNKADFDYTEWQRAYFDDVGVKSQFLMSKSLEVAT